jgi:hypothetical protein
MHSLLLSLLLLCMTNIVISNSKVNYIDIIVLIPTEKNELNYSISFMLSYTNVYIYGKQPKIFNGTQIERYVADRNTVQDGQSLIGHVNQYLLPTNTIQQIIMVLKYNDMATTHNFCRMSSNQIYVVTKLDMMGL